jgi:membrane-associated phospholipid phosphatase
MSYLALEATDAAVEGLKDVTDRRRPDASDDRSFPSGDATRVSLRATLASRNARTQLANHPLDATSAACASLAILSAWSRLEARRHFASDVLAGIALGHVMGALTDEAFIGAAAGTRVAVVPSHRGVSLRVQWTPP